MDGHFRKEMPRHFEFPREIPRRYAAVPHAPHGTRFAREPIQNAEYIAVSCFAKSKGRNTNQIRYIIPT